MAKNQDIVQEQREEDVTAEQGGAGEVGTSRQSGDGLRNGHPPQALVDRREGSGGERSEQELPGRGSTSARADRSKIARPDPELVPQAKRRRFSAKYKLDILRQSDACEEPGELGALLRREGLYYSHLTTWRCLVRPTTGGIRQQCPTGNTGATRTPRTRLCLLRLPTGRKRRRSGRTGP